MSVSGIVSLEPSKALKTQVYEALKELIGHMDIYSSKELIRLDERALGDQLGVSRTPVREAISRLEQEGIVQNICTSRRLPGTQKQAGSSRYRRCLGGA
jgi:DNA-binding GntR family transcriptional regulator